MNLGLLFRTFRFRATVLFAALALLIAAALSAALGKLLSAQIALDQGDRLEVIARNTATMFAEGLSDRLREVQLLAESDSFRADAFNPTRSGKLLQRMLETRPNYQWIGIADARGTVRVATADRLLGADVAQRPWFKTGTQSAVVGDVHEAKLLAKLMPQAPDGSPLRFVDYSAPIFDLQGKLVGVLGVHASWDWAREVSQRMLPKNAREEEIELFVLDRKDQVLYPWQAAAMQVPPKLGSPALLAWPAQGQFLTAQARLPSANAATDMGWRIVVRQPAAVALAAAQQARLSAIAAGAVAALGFAVLAWLAAGYLATPLARIAAAARRIQRGEPNVQIPRTGHGYELDHLSSALQAMTEAMRQRKEELRRANEELEQRVRERTAELQAANTELDSLVRKDGLTGAFNRRAADERLREECARFSRHGHVAAVLLADIDFFKRVNDQHGHAVGDMALQHVALRLQGSVRSMDFVARFGGEEFLLILPETPLSGALELAERLRQLIASAPPAPLQTLSVSIGVAALEGDSEHTLRQADQALYAAKASGRNRVVLAPGAGQEAL